MNGGLAIGLRGPSVETQDRSVRDAWLLMAGWIVIGVACSRLLLEFFHLRSPLFRDLPRRSHAQASAAIVRETWASSETFLTVSVAAAAALFVLLPGAESLADILR